jgi:hypothetical protein
MFKILTPALVFFVSVAVFAQTAVNPSAPRERKLYVGKNSTEATMSFKAQVEIATTKEVDEEVAGDQIENQVNHLYGPLAAAKYKGVPKGDHKITGVKIAKKQGVRNTYVISYSYKGTIVVENGPSSKYEIILPVNPDKIYKAGMTTRRGEDYNPCTDDHYQSEGDFWYFWNPDQPGCKLKEGVDYLRVQSAIDRTENTRRTYPEYARLADSKGVISISILMGMDDTEASPNPDNSNDANAPNFVGIRDELVKMGYQVRVVEKDELKEATGDAKVLPYVEELTKSTPKAKFVVTLFFGQTQITDQSQAFHYYYADALKNASVMIYDGHSGLGGNLDLAGLAEAEGIRFTPNKSRYQIYYFNSCTSYSYYNTMYFAKKRTPTDKRGTKNLDIITAGLETMFSSMGESDLTLLKAIDAWAMDKGVLSYQKLTEQTDSGNLLGINGDEDNPTEPDDEAIAGK